MFQSVHLSVRESVHVYVCICVTLQRHSPTSLPSTSSVDVRAERL